MISAVPFEEDFIPVGNPEKENTSTDGWTNDAVKFLSNLIFRDLPRYNELNCHEKRKVSNCLSQRLVIVITSLWFIQHS